MIDHFTRDQFECALPLHKDTGHYLWFWDGLIDGEHTYRIRIPTANDLYIAIRSTVQESGVSASTGKDSIRCWLMNLDGRPMAAKVTRWITRVPGWEIRMKDTLRYLYKLSLCLSPCPKCGLLRSARRVKKAGANHGRVFQKCECPGTLEWLPDCFTKSSKK